MTAIINKDCIMPLHRVVTYIRDITSNSVGTWDLTMEFPKRIAAVARAKLKRA